MKRADSAAAAALLSVAALILFESRNLSFGALRTPQTGFFPKILAVLLLLLTLAALLQSLRRRAAEGDSTKISSDGWSRICATLATLVGFALLLEPLGFLLSTFLLMVLLLRAVEAPPWPKVAIVALLTALGSYVIFAWLLGVPLPGGIVGF